MTNFRSEETRRHDGMAEVEGSKWSNGDHENPFGPTTFTQWVLAKLTCKTCRTGITQETHAKALASRFLGK